MIEYLISVFIIGAFIPYIARRFAKFMPATPAYALVQIFRWIPKAKSEKGIKLQRSYYWRSFMAGLTAAILLYAFAYKYNDSNVAVMAFWVWMLMLLAEIDMRMQILPDILTVPLLIVGYATAVYGWGWINTEESVIGSIVGYLLPVVASLPMVKKNPDAFGGGDIKLLAAIGAWLGAEALVYVIVGASSLMAVYMLLSKRKMMAFGPALAMVAIIVALCIF